MRQIGTSVVLVTLLLTSFLWYATPTLAAGIVTVYPTSGYAGTIVTVSGYGFSGNETGIYVIFDGAVIGTPVTAINGSWTTTSVIPSTASAGAHQISAISVLTTPITPVAFTIISQSTIAISSFSPSSGGYGTNINIYGTNFTYVTGVFFGGTAALSYSIISSNQLTATVGSGSSGNVSISSTNGTATSMSLFTYHSGTPDYGGIIRWATPVGPQTPIGWPAESVGVSPFSMQLGLQTLLKEQSNGSLTPCLATSYRVQTTPTNPAIDFNLRKGVKFHDGTDFNAPAVKWNLEQVKAGGLYLGVTSNWKSFDVIDDYTLRVNLTTWSNRFIRDFAEPVSFMVSPTAYNKNGTDWMRWNMVGTGPFMQNDFQKDIFLKAVKNPNYWETGKPYLDGIQLLYIADETTRLAAFKTGHADVLDCTNKAGIANQLAMEGYKVIAQLRGPLSLVPDSLNANSPWANYKVRLALEYGIDKETISNTFGYGYTKPAYQVNNPLSIAYDPQLADREYNPAKAKQFLAEAGYPNGFMTRIITSSAQNIDVIVALQAYLSKIGIQASLDIKDMAQFMSIAQGTWDNALLCFPLVQWPNPNTGFNQYFGDARSWFQSLKLPAGWSSLLNTSLVTATPDPVISCSCEDALYNDATVIPVFYDVSLWATTNSMQETYLGSRGMANWWESQLAWLEQTVPADAPLSLNPALVGPIGIGQTFNLELKTNAGSAQQVSGVDAFVNFDSSKLEVIDADPAQIGIQITAGSSLNAVINNSVDNTAGLISYTADKLGAPFPAGSFNVATIQFRTKTVTGAVTTTVTISLSGNSTTSVVDFGGIPIIGNHGDASVQIVPGANVTFNVVLQGGSRPDSGCIVPLTIKLFAPGVNAPTDVLSATPLYTYNLTTNKIGGKATAQIIGVNPGIFDISVFSPHCLINVKRNVSIFIPSLTVDLGVLLEGNANDDGKINIQDFGILALSYGKLIGEFGYDNRADFDRNGIINISDFGLLASNYAGTSPVEILISYSGMLTYNNQPLSNFTDKNVHLWVRNENTGQAAIVENLSYNPANSQYSFTATAGTYGLQASVDNDGNGWPLPGDFYSWTVMQAFPGDTMSVNDGTMMRVLHLTSPGDNAQILPDTSVPKPSFPQSQLIIQWEAIAEASTYNVAIDRYTEQPFNYLSSVLSTSITGTELSRWQLSVSSPGEFYLLRINAFNAQQKQVGMLMVKYQNGYGWDYRFKVGP
jgi:peptide/nickel transport system substrate-binding protein